MLVNFNVQNFGCIKEKQCFSMEATRSNELKDYYVVEPIKGLRLLKLGLIYGPNASGKTTLLNALDFLLKMVISPLTQKNEKFDFKPFLFDAQTPNENTIFSIEFVQHKIRYFYEVAFNQEAIIQEELYFYNPNKANIYKRTTNTKKQFTQIKFGSKIKIEKSFIDVLEGNTLWNNTVLGGFLKTNIQNEELQNAIQWFTNTLKPLINPKTELTKFVSVRLDEKEINKKAILALLQKADLGITGILIHKEEKAIPNELLELIEKDENIPKDRKEKIKQKGTVTSIDLQLEHTAHKYPLPIELESRGTERYYGLAGILALTIKEVCIFPIDELESSLHPDLFLHFILTFLSNAKHSQIIATTHNRELLQDKDIFRNDVIWFTEKNESNATILYSLADFDTTTIRDTSNVYNAYKIGKLGAIPNLGDYFLNLDEDETKEQH